MHQAADAALLEAGCSRCAWAPGCFDQPRGVLTGTQAPLQALHLALTEPHSFLRGLPAGLGVSASMDDACLAYRMFDQVGAAWRTACLTGWVLPGPPPV